jgi:predicted RNase H-like nuclease
VAPRSPTRRAVLGLDAAWTAGQPSGVALVVEDGRRWRCAALAPSYDAFTMLAAGRAVDWDGPVPRGSWPDASALLAAAARLAPGADLAVVAADLPLARTPILRRRPADDAVSRAFGARGCGVHSPSAARPGPLADRLRENLEALGYPLATAREPAPRALLEVYPHTALLSLLDLDYRLPYKLSRARRYWSDETPAQRVRHVVLAWRRVLRALESRVDGIALPLPSVPRSAGRLKRLEDALDALLCAWVGMAYLAGRAEPHGDADAAIWCPRAEGRAASRPRREHVRPSS